MPRIINNITQNKLTQRYYDDYPYFKTDKQKEDLIVPLWAIHKIDVLNGVVRMLKKNKAYQGIDYKTNK